MVLSDQISSSTMSLAKDHLSGTATKAILSIPLALEASYNRPRFQLGYCTSRYILLLPLQPVAANTARQTVRVSLPHSLPGPMTLHENETPLPLAQVVPGGGRGPYSYSVTLLGSSVAGGLQRQSKGTWSFALPICTNGETVTFEWRRLRGSKVKQLGASFRGWKLVRTKSVCCKQDVFTQNRDFYYSGTKKNEEEHIVAVWAKTSDWTGLVFAMFALIGRVGDGEWSHRFAIMAI